MRRFWPAVVVSPLLPEAMLDAVVQHAVDGQPIDTVIVHRHDVLPDARPNAPFAHRITRADHPVPDNVAGKLLS